MSGEQNVTVEMIPIDEINILNPRDRGKPKFQQIVKNIDKLGLKKPIRVRRRKPNNGDKKFDLVYGQGRILAFQALGAKEIPAIVVDVSKEEALLMGLVENLARRLYTSVELVKQVNLLRERGYTFRQIARKTALDPNYVKGLIRLSSKGEERLIQAVERGEIPIYVAVTIATAEDHDIQRFLQDAYKDKTLRGRELLNAKKIIEKRKSNGKSIYHRPVSATTDDEKSHAIMRQYRQETRRQRELIKKAKLCENRLLFVVTALRKLFKSKQFVALLKSEALDTLPTTLAEQINREGD